MSHSIPLDVALGRLADELSVLEAAGSRVETAVGDLAARSSGGTPSSSLQELDLMVQTMRDLATFAATLASVAPAEQIPLARATRDLKLERVRAILSGQPDTSQTAEDVLF